MLALIVGTILAVGALGYVLFPLLTGTMPITPRRHGAARVARSAESEAVAALREIEFDRATGKLSDNDYDELKTRYTARALQAIRVGGAAPAEGAAEDAAEAAVLAYRARMARCGTCGPRPEPDAIYCSSCGAFLPGVCGGCGAAVTESGAAFCTSCGRQLAA
jgi:hypothetical protein